MTKLSDVQPGQFFRQVGREPEGVYLKIAIDSAASYTYKGCSPKRHLSIRLSSFKITTWTNDVDVCIVKPEDI